MDLEKNKIEKVKSKLIDSCKSLVITVSDNDYPDIGYAPYIYKDKYFYIFSSELSSHIKLIINKKVGTFGAMSNFSFYFGHHMTTIEGGTVCTNDAKTHDIVRMLRSHGMTREASEETKEKFRSMLRDNQLNDKEIEIAIDQKSNPFQSLDIPGMPGAQMGMLNMNDIFGKGLKNKKKTKLKIGEAYEPLIQEEIEKIAEKQNVVQNAIKSVQESGIVFIDEIDKIAPNSERRGGDVSREGVQRDLLPLIEGTVVSTKYGTVETNHILFIASGAFHQSKPSDLLPELQGRLPVRVRLNALKKEDFVRILKDTDNSLTKQYKSLFETENIDLQFDDEAIDEIANLTEQINKEVENIGARRLQTMFEKILEKLSFEANLSEQRTEVVSRQWVSEAIQSEIKPTDEKKFIL